MGRHWRRVVLALVCIYLHVGTSDDYKDEVSCVNAMVGYETDNRQRIEYWMEPQTELFKIIIPQCEKSDKAGVSVTVCETRATPSLMLEEMDYAIISRSGDNEKPGHADLIVYCK